MQRRRPDAAVCRSLPENPDRKLSGNDRQDDLGHRAGAVVDGLSRDARPGLGRDIAAGVWIAVVSREVAARDLDANAMAAHEDHAGRPKLYLDSFRPARTVVRTADDSVRDVVGGAIRADVDEFRSEIGAGCVGRYVQDGAYRTGHLGLMLQR